MAKSKTGALARPPEGKIRRSQVITTYGPGALVDLVDDAVVVWGLDSWRFDKRLEPIEEQRLRERIAPRLKHYGITLAQQAYFRAPPEGDEQQPKWFRGIKATPFPQWVVCQNPKCRRLLRCDQLDRKRDRYVHDCTKKPSICVPVRFVAACRSGHLDEFPWLWFVHNGQHDKKKCPAPALKLLEGRTGDFAGIQVTCSCGSRRRLVESKHQPKLNPRCSGRRPWLGRMGKEPGCKHHLELLVRTASNGYFSVTESALSIPEEGSRLRDAVMDHWQVLQAANTTTLPAFRAIPVVAQAIADWSDAEVLEVVKQIKAGQKPPREEIRKAEYKRFTGADVLKPGDLPAPAAVDFFARRLAASDLLAPLPLGVKGVTLAYKLREVRAQLGFTRFAPVPRNLKGEAHPADDVELAMLGLATDWLPAVEILGEGVFIELDEEAVRAWEQRPAVQEWEQELLAGFDSWLKGRGASGAVFPGIRFYMLHSLAHLLITQLSLECGYAASAIRERVYCDSTRTGQPMAGILLSTGTPGTEGTLGGLVDQGRRIGHHLRRAAGLGALCSNDPVCAQHSPKGDLSERYLDGAACYACLFIAESSCEWFNHYLDRSVVIPAVGQSPDRAFFGYTSFSAVRTATGQTGSGGGGPSAADGEVREPRQPVGPPVAEDLWSEVLADCMLPNAARLVDALREADMPLPQVGEEFGDGFVVELAWPSAKVAVLDEAITGSEPAPSLIGEGWHAFGRDVDPSDLIAVLRKRA